VREKRAQALSGSHKISWGAGSTGTTSERLVCVVIVLVQAAGMGAPGENICARAPRAAGLERLSAGPPSEHICRGHQERPWILIMRPGVPRVGSWRRISSLGFIFVPFSRVGLRVGPRVVLLVALAQSHPDC
jgi:hypothetical protein